jgi:hypothetical protein
MDYFCVSDGRFRLLDGDKITSLVSRSMCLTVVLLVMCTKMLNIKLVNALSSIQLFDGFHRGDRVSIPAIRIN